MKKNLFSVLVASLITVISTQIFAQGTGNSPYSAVGVGELVPNAFAANLAMGGTGVSYGNIVYINNVNPALLVKKQYTAFDVGLNSQYKRLSSGSASQRDFGMNLNYLSLALPAHKNWTMGLTFQPYTSVDYESRFVRTITNSEKQAETRYSGKGGISKASFSNGVRIGKYLYVGLETAFYFGSISKDTTSITEYTISGVTEANHLKFTERTSVGGSGLKLGAAYQQPINKKWQLNIGATYEKSNRLKADRLNNYQFLIESTGGNGPTIARTPDTLAQSTGNYTLPSKYAIGFSFESPLKWVFAVDYSRQDWGKFKNFDGTTSPNLTASSQLAFGLEHIPNIQSTKYTNQIGYRLGFQTTKTPYLINNQQINDRSFSFGLTLPVGKVSPSFVTLTTILGRRGTTENNLIQENYTKIVLGFSLNSLWFQKVRID